MNKVTFGKINHFTGSVLSVTIPYNKSYNRDYFLTNLDITLTTNAPKLDKLQITTDLYGICVIKVTENNVSVNTHFPIIYYTDGSIIINVIGTLRSMQINIENINSDSLFEVPKQKIYFFRPPDTVQVKEKYIATSEGYIILNTEYIPLFSLSIKSNYPNGIPIKANRYIAIVDKDIKINTYAVGLARAVVINHADVYVECRLNGNTVYIYNEYIRPGNNNQNIFIPNQNIIFT